jgi:hypothetical protein
VRRKSHEKADGVRRTVNAEVRQAVVEEEEEGEEEEEEVLSGSGAPQLQRLHPLPKVFGPDALYGGE